MMTQESVELHGGPHDGFVIPLLGVEGVCMCHPHGRYEWVWGEDGVVRGGWVDDLLTD